MITGGYILQPRKVDESAIMHDSPITRELWFYLIRKVNYKDNGKFKRGTGFFNLSDIADDLHWFVGYRKMMYKKSALTKALRRLHERNMIETMKETRGVFVSICNYEYYQDPASYEGNDEESAKDQRRSNGVITISKERKEEELINTTIVVLSHPSEETHPNFTPEIHDDSKIGDDKIEKQTSDRIDYKGIADYWNKNDHNMPKLQVMTEKRKGAVRARWKEHGRKAVAAVLQKSFSSKFLNGNNRENWIADFDWIFRPNNFVKILEGKYNDEKTGRYINGRQLSSAEEAYLRNSNDLIARAEQEVQGL